MDFELTEQHVKLIQNANWHFEPSYGSEDVIQQDRKRPYGNGDLTADLMQILCGVKPDYEGYPDEGFSREEIERALRVHREVFRAFEVCISARSFTPGLYRNEGDAYTPKWVHVAEEPSSALG